MLLCLSASHLNADFDLLERLSLGAPSAKDALVESGDVVTGAVVLATCNRFEAYLDIDEPLTAAREVAVEATIAALATASGVSEKSLHETLSVYTGEEVAGHLFAVTSGLESVVVGEDEISGQVARALTTARAAGTSTSSLERLFQHAAKTSRGVRTTALAGTHRSLVGVALDMVSSRVSDWSAERVLVIGTGRYAATTVRALRDRGATDLRSYSPSGASTASGNADAFALRHGARREVDLVDAIADADIVITCTTSVAVEPAHVTDTRRRMVVDLGLPRNVAPEVGALEGVELLDLETVRLHAPLDLLAPATDARAMVGAAAARYSAEAKVEPAIVAFRSHVLGVLDDELARATKRGASEETLAAMRHLVGVLVHTPSARARELAHEGRGEDFAAAVETVFGITVDPAAASSADEDAATA